MTIGKRFLIIFCSEAFEEFGRVGARFSTAAAIVFVMLLLCVFISLIVYLIFLFVFEFVLGPAVEEFLPGVREFGCADDVVAEPGDEILDLLLLISILIKLFIPYLVLGLGFRLRI